MWWDIITLYLGAFCKLINVTMYNFRYLWSFNWVWMRLWWLHQQHVGLWRRSRLSWRQWWGELYMHWVHLCRRDDVYSVLVAMWLRQWLRRLQRWIEWLHMRYVVWIWVWKWRLRQWHVGLWWWTRLLWWQWWKWLSNRYAHIPRNSWIISGNAGVKWNRVPLKP